VHKKRWSDAMDEPSGSGLAVEVAASTPPDRGAVTATFTRHSLGKVCTLVRSAGVRASLAPRDIEDLLIAVSEIATNAIRYAGGIGSITLQRLTSGLLAEIRDNGPWLPDGLLIEARQPDVLDGRGLWLARLLSKDFEFVSSPSGVVVRIFTPCAAAP
jgi:anti-sigma regulatory factor (Ser/Thr protein kinase)